jgi:hypothetical protein
MTANDWTTGRMAGWPFNGRSPTVPLFRHGGQTRFGTSVIELTPFELGGAVDLTFANNGLTMSAGKPLWLGSVARLQLGYTSRGDDLELIAIEAARISKVGIVRSA